MDRDRWLQAVAWSATLVVSALLYLHENSLVHFMWHLGYGAAFGLLMGAAWTLWRGAPGRLESLWPLAGYLYMAIPDLLWLAPTVLGRPPWPHQPWMDVFLAHYSLDLWPLATPMLVPALSLGLVTYLLAKRRSAGQAAW